MPPTLKFYSHILSQPCRAVYSFLNMNNIQYEYESVNVLKGEQKTKVYKEINPFSTVPVIVDGDLKLGESVAILRYLCAKHAPVLAPNWYPSDAKQRAKIDQYLSWHHTNTRLYSVNLIMKSFMDPLSKKEPPNEKQVNSAMNKMYKVAGALDTIFLHDTKFINGHEVSIADLMAYHEFELLALTDFEITPRTPKLMKWYSNMENLLEEVWQQDAYILKSVKTMTAFTPLLFGCFRLIPRRSKSSL